MFLRCFRVQRAEQWILVTAMDYTLSAVTFETALHAVKLLGIMNSKGMLHVLCNITLQYPRNDMIVPPVATMLYIPETK